MEKYNLIPEQLCYEGTITEENLYQPGKIDERTILLTHDLGYWHKLKEGLTQEIRKTGFPFSAQCRASCDDPNGTIQNACVPCSLGLRSTARVVPSLSQIGEGILFRMTLL